MKILRTVFILIISLFFTHAWGQHKIPLYAHGNSGNTIAGSFKTVVAIVGQNVIGESQNTNNKAFFGLMAPITFYVTGIDQSMVNTFYLGQNYPNPYKYATSIPFNIDVQAKVKLSILDITGREIMVLTDRNYPPGKYSEKFDVINFKPGLYFYRLNVNNYQQTKTMVLLE